MAFGHRMKIQICMRVFLVYLPCNPASHSSFSSLRHQKNSNIPSCSVSSVNLISVCMSLRCWRQSFSIFFRGSKLRICHPHIYISGPAASELFLRTDCLAVDPYQDPNDGDWVGLWKASWFKKPDAAVGPEIRHCYVFMLFHWALFSRNRVWLEFHVNTLLRWIIFSNVLL